MAATTDTQRRLKREVWSWLQESYDEKAACYKTGFSDDSIAKETGASPHFVKTQREELYGPMGEPAELTALRAEFKAHNDAAITFMADHQRKTETFHTRLDRLCIKNNWVNV